MKEIIKSWDIVLVFIAVFYCVPIRGVSFGNIASDIRVYDFVLFGFILLNLKYITFRSQYPQINRVLKGIFYLLTAFIVGFFVSMLFKLSVSSFFILLVRFVRMINYLLVFVILINKVTSIKTTFLIIDLFYLLCIVNAVVSVLQSQDILPLFWPAYWLGNYRFSDWPTAFLSPHHLQIGVVMLIASGIGFLKFYTEKNIFLKYIHPTITFLAIYVIFLNGSRTGIFLSLFIIILLLIQIRKFNFTFLLLLPIMIYFLSIKNNVTEFITSRYKEVVTDQIEGKGSLSSTRTIIYFEDFPRIIYKNPWVLITGAGFQNYSMVGITSSAGHNNYIQYIVELGFLGFFSFFYFLYAVYRCLIHNLKLQKMVKSSKIRNLNFFSNAFFITLLLIMFFNEVIYPQYPLFTLPLQVLIILLIPFLLNKTMLDYLNQLKNTVP